MVESWGRGKPDFYVPTVNTAPTIIREQTTQEKWVQNAIYSIAGFSSITANFYTVPTGYILQLTGAYISSDNSVINKMRILDDSTIILGDYRFDMRGDISWTSILTIEAGHKIVIYLWNNDNENSELSLTLSGILEKVE